MDKFCLYEIQAPRLLGNLRPACAIEQVVWCPRQKGNLPDAVPDAMLAPIREHGLYRITTVKEETGSLVTGIKAVPGTDDGLQLSCLL